MSKDRLPSVFDEFFADDLNNADARGALNSPPAETEETPADANAKVNRNLHLALDRQGEVLSQPITPEMDPKDKRLTAEVAHHAVRTAIQVDENRLRRQTDDILPKIARAIAEEKERLKPILEARDRERLRLSSTPEGTGAQDEQ
jgi:hypothetical protein